jgi:enoyl-CoA hydratase/carnithine racemase
MKKRSVGRFFRLMKPLCPAGLKLYPDRPKIPREDTFMTAIHLATVGTETGVLLREDAGGVATLTLNRPDQFNALSAALLAALESALHALANDRLIRVVVIAGAGKAFCAGHDLKEIHEHAEREFAKEAFESCRRVMTELTRLPQPVIARVHGPAYAAGCQLVAQCDLAVAVTDARFATSGVNYGVFCSTPGVPLSRNIPRKLALEMLLTGDPIDAATAAARGLVNRVVPAKELDAEVRRLAQSIIAKSPTVVAAGKSVFYEQVEKGMEQAYRDATAAMVDNVRTEDGKEGIAAFAEKRKPRWKGK